MAVAVVHADGNESQSCIQRPVQRRTLVGRTVVGDLDHIHRPDGARGEQRILRRLPQVAEEDRPDSAPFRLQGEAPCVPGVQIRRRARRRLRRPEQPPVDRPQATGHTRMSALDRDTGRSEYVERAMVSVAHRSLHDRTLDAGRHPAHAAHMIGVEVGEDEQVELPDPQAIEARGRRRGLTSDIDHRYSISVAQQHAVALADIAGGQLPVTRHRKSAAECTAAPRADVDQRAGAQREHRDDRDDPRRTAREHQHGDGCQDARAEQHADHAGRPRQSHPGERAGERRHLRDPRGGHPGEPHDQLPDGRSPGRHRAGQASEHRGDRRRRLGEQVGGDSEQGQRWRQQDQDRLARQLGCGRNRDRQREGAREPAREQATERTRQDEQPGRREDRQRKAVVAREPRIVDQEQHHRQRQGRDAVGRPPARQPDEENTGHRRRTDDTGARSDQRDEGQESDACHQDARPPAETDEASEQEDQPDDERAVRPRHGGEVTERGGGHRLVQLR